MKLGTFSVDLPLYEIESQVTYQTVRSPTVFERMVMRLCGRYRDTPDIANMTLSQIFEQQLGVASATELVGPSVENLIYLGVLANPASQGYMSLRLADLSLTPDGFVFLERDRLPSRSKQATVTHLFFPLLNAVKPHRAGSRLSTPPNRPYVDDSVLQPADCSPLVREALAGEPHEWKSPNTEIHSVQSQVARVVWDRQLMVVECDESGVLTVKAAASPDLDRWLAVADPEVVWQNILEPVLVSDSACDWPELGETALRRAEVITPFLGEHNSPNSPSISQKAILRILSDETQLEHYPNDNVIVLRHSVGGIRRLQSKEGTIALEALIPKGLPAGFEELVLHRGDLSPSLFVKGFVKLFWAGQPRSGVLSITKDQHVSALVWGTIESALQTGINSMEDTEVLALAAIWESPVETILRWRSRVAALPLKRLISDASLFVSTLGRFAPQSGDHWTTDWQNALSYRLATAISRLEGEVPLNDLLEYLSGIDQLLPTQASPLPLDLLAHCGSFADVESIASLRKAVGPSLALPYHVFGDALLHKWVSQALTDEPISFFGPHVFVEPIELLRCAHQALLMDVGLKSLDDAENGNLSLRGVKTSALASVTRWQSAIDMVRNMRSSLMGQSLERLAQLDQKVGAWRELASQMLAPPAPAGQRYIVLDTNALMDMPDLLASTMRRGGIPIVPKRVLEELNRNKGASNEENAQKARAAIRALERAGQGVKYESEVVELLPSDWELSSDNRILSVALYLRLSDVVLVTGDINLRTKARGENMSAMLPDEYLGIGSSQGGRRETAKGRR